MDKRIASSLDDVVSLAHWMSTSVEFRDFVVEAAKVIVESYRNGGRILVCGNGGSAADAQHFAAELVGRYNFDRPPLPALALNTDTSILTAVGNDYGFDKAFARQVYANASQGDVLVGFSTSGSSSNVLAAFDAGRERRTKLIALTGRRGESLRNVADVCLVVPSAVTPRIQEVHQVAYHLVCHLVEGEMFGHASGRVSR